MLYIIPKVPFSMALKNILFVCTLPALRRHLETLLSKTMLSITYSDNAEAALQTLQSQSYDYVILSPYLGKEDCYSFATKIRDDNNLRSADLLILNCRENWDDGIDMPGLEAGIDDTITFPFTPQQLFKKLESLAQLDSFYHLNLQNNQAEEMTCDLIDMKQINTFIEFVGKDRTQEIVREFKSLFAEKEEILSAPETDAQTISQELHALASTSGNLGMAQFSQLCRLMMNDLNTGKDEDRAAKIANIQDIYIQSLEKLEQLLHS